MTPHMHPLMAWIEECLAGVMPAESIEIRGTWSTTTRRQYKDQSQLGTGEGPFMDVVDMRWRGSINCAKPVAGLAVLHHGPSLYWVKSSPASPNPPVEVSLHTYRDFLAGRATFTAWLAGEGLPGIPVSCGSDPVKSCAMGTKRTATGRVHLVAEIDGAAFVVILFQGELLKTGRNRIWRLRDEIAARLPADVRDLLTRRRTGVVRTVDNTP